MNGKLLFTAGLYIAESCVVLARKQLSAIYRPGLRSRNRPQMRFLRVLGMRWPPQADGVLMPLQWHAFRNDRFWCPVGTV